MKHRSTALLALLLTSLLAHAQPAKTPRQLIDHLGVDIRQSLENSKAGKTPEDLERAVADQITGLIGSAEGHLSLTDTDNHGRTPLMLAASYGYAQVVRALLADPSVKLRINQPDDEGATAWMLANFAPALTLVACEPGTLTAERYVLLPPYLRRMSYLLKTKGAAVGSVVQMLEAAGAEANADEAKRMWLARCPNAAPELREALAGGDLMRTLINDALVRQRNFNKLAHDSPRSVPLKPPVGMRFVHSGRRAQRGGQSPLLNMDQMDCQWKRPEFPAKDPNWTGTMEFKITVVTRAGIVEAADIDRKSPKDVELGIEELFRGVIIDALAGYRCDGDHVFEQEFQFKIG